MAPLDEHAVATVFSTQVKSHDEKTILVEAGAFTPMRWFLEHAADGQRDDADMKPSKKRRKKSHDNDASIDRHVHVHHDNAENEIPIHRVRLDLHFPETLSTRPANAKSLLEDVEFDDRLEVAVVPYGISEDSAGTRLRLTTPKDRDAVLFVDLDHIPTEARDAIRQIALPGQLKTAFAKQRATENPATKIKCTLKRSVGQLFTAVRLEAAVMWRSGISAFPAGMPVGKARVYEDYEFLAQAYPDREREKEDQNASWSPADFYESVHVPNKSLQTEGLCKDILDSELYPFQRRAVAWMLRREGVEERDQGLVGLSKSQMLKERLSFYEPVEDLSGQLCFVNYLQGILSRELPADGKVLSGGLLAEEMGLGKTVELMALIALHRRPEAPSGQVRDDYSETCVTPSKATLIITPNSILEQWRSELRRHAPALKVHLCKGISRGQNAGESQDDIIKELAEDYDVVLATYNTLAQELHFAEDPPERSRRHERKYARKRSPLVQIQWWRICLDEAQMVESGVTAAARVACRLPRLNSWAVSGTPLRKNVQDLHGLLIFLRYSPLNESPKLWNHLITNHRHLFKKIFGEIALRHTKSQIREELRLPPQKRVVLTVPFSAVEQQHYTTLFDEMCEDVGLNSDGSPKVEDWDPTDPGTVEMMRTWLARLRQTCLHPQVGGRNRKALGRGQGPLRTVSEVLEVMIDQNETNIRVEERAVLNAQLQRAHVLGNDGKDDHRSEKALEIYQNAMRCSAELVQEARDRLANAKTMLAAKGESTAESDDEESSESVRVLGRLRNNLRTALQLEHICTFFAATATFQIKSNEALTKAESQEFKDLEDQETVLYDRAKMLRKEILIDNSRKAETLMHKIEDLKEKGKMTKMPPIKDLNLAGIEGRRIVEKADELFEIIREQSNVICEWRGKMAEFLIKPLVDEDEGVETTGEEYEESTKLQDELYVYFDAVKAMQADLNTFITGEDAPLIDHEVKTLIRDARWFLDPKINTEGMVVHAPELQLKLLGKRNEFRAHKDRVGSVRGLIQEARLLESSIQYGGGPRAESERSLARGHLNALQRVFTDYTKAISGLEKEVDLFRSTQNQRLEFYRQLQELSDAVAPYKEELDERLDTAALETAMEKEDKLSKSLAQLKTKNRFLLNLRDESGNQDGPKICVICQCPFENGVLTVCGHQYCKECIQHWWSQHRTCPVCKRKLVSQDFHNITYKPKEYKAQEEFQSGSSSPGSHESEASPTKGPSSIYSDVDSKLLDEIKTIDLPSSYGTKIDTLGRHLHWIREHDPGAKSIVFSQYREFLDVLGTALADFKIGYSRLGRAGAVEKFRHDPSVDCLLLDAKSDSSGMTLVNATHVFICEPLIQTAIELQAIARVHRIGQTRPTTVWMYLINDTVEEAIYEMSVTRRLAHVQSRQQSRTGKSRSTTPSALQENAIDAANSEEMQSAPLSKLLVAGKGGGELVEENDLWQCLFGKTQKATVQPSVELENEVGRHLRAEAAEGRRDAAMAGSQR
ncbi:hypothetical protein D0865_14784 [Hortaea werneckii]|uniref:RING-type domain-containing protein n=1 Tax=Hortaea werneckii TaxID=91943 RepID=A0A3M7AXG5_HORWE|nr:hypothetical protein D0865_14784 [Hortaea werneckii]